MAVLSSLLPGLRAVRAPLIAGFTLLLALWLAVEPSIPDAANASGLVHSVYRLDETFSAFGAVAVVSVSAYILGSLYIVLAGAAAGEWLPRVLMLRFPGARPQFRDLPPILRDTGRDDRDVETVRRIAMRRLAMLLPSSALWWRLGAVVQGAVDDVLTTREAETGAESGARVQSVDMELRRSLSIRVFADLLDDWRSLPLSAIGDALYAEIDRLEAEADFRAALAGPLAVLAVVVLARSAPSVWVSVLTLAAMTAVLTALAFAWRHARIQANTAIADGILTGKLVAPSLQPTAIRRRLERP